ncbi:MAG: hypothetical protein WCI29_11650 [Actinomycetes bacterium]
MRSAYRLRQVVNALNFSTLSGLVLAKFLGAQLRRGPDGLVLATSGRRQLPYIGAITIGNVIVLPGAGPWSAELMAHETRHAGQWAACVIVFLPLYWLACAWSFARCGDHFSGNWFERDAGLHAGGYLERPPRTLWRGKKLNPPASG